VVIQGCCCPCVWLWVSPLQRVGLLGSRICRSTRPWRAVVTAVAGHMCFRAVDSKELGVDDEASKGSILCLLMPGCVSTALLQRHLSKRHWRTCFVPIKGDRAWEVYVFSRGRGRLPWIWRGNPEDLLSVRTRNNDMGACVTRLGPKPSAIAWGSVGRIVIAKTAANNVLFSVAIRG
jgi:hypothetical protein